MNEQENNFALNLLTKKFPRTILSKVRKAIEDYRLIEDGDRIAVCMSGGKDSALLAAVMLHFARFGQIKPSLSFVMLDPGLDKGSLKAARHNFAAVGISAEIVSVNTFRAAKNSDNPCFLCSRMRRKQLYEYAAAKGFNKIALGHHYDDVCETVLMGMLYGGQMQTMLPRRSADHYPGISLIRPLYLVRESEIIRWADICGIISAKCGCPAAKDGTAASKRGEIKSLIAELDAVNPQIKSNIFRSAENVDLRNLMSYKDKNGIHSFMDKF